MKEKLRHEFTSKMAPLITAFIKEKRSLGYSYENEENFLWQFDRFLVESNLDYGVINNEVMELWCLKRDTEIENSRKYRVDATRGLVKYLQDRNIEAVMPPTFKFTPRKLPYIPSFSEIQLLFEYIDSHPELKAWLEKDSSKPPRLVLLLAPVLLRIIYCLGLRISETTHLKIANLNFSTGQLLIDHSKGDRQRIVYLPEDLLQLTADYLNTLHDFKIYSVWLFPGKYTDKHISNVEVNRFFRKSWAEGVQKVTHKEKRPTIHGLRHCFVVHKIAIWASEGRDIHALLPYLSKHLGHVSVAETYHYFHQIEHLVPSVRAFLQVRQPLKRIVYEFKEE